MVSDSWYSENCLDSPPVLMLTIQATLTVFGPYRNDLVLVLRRHLICSFLVISGEHALLILWN